MATDNKAYRLQQFLKWRGGWAAIYYALTGRERREFFDRLAEQIIEFEKGEENK